MVDFDDKLAYFQAITGLDDPDLCTEILAAHGWDLELAISAFTTSNSASVSNPNNDNDDHNIAWSRGQPNSESWEGVDQSELTQLERDPVLDVASPPGLAWKLITLPFSVISGSLGLISGAIGLGMWVAGGVLSHSLGLLGLGPGRNGDASSSPLVTLSAAASEAAYFAAGFERDFGMTRPNFVAEGFMDALQRSRQEFKLLFVYLHSPDHPDTPLFCERSLCSEVVASFINENFVSWGGSIRASEGFKMSNSLKASRFPFCAVVMAATNQRIALLQQIEGPKSPEQLLTVLQRVAEESASVLVSARLDAEERRTNVRLREEQDAAYRTALEADQARERQRKEEQERLEREAAETERKQREEEEARQRAAQEAAEKEAALARRRQEKAMSLGDEPEKGPGVTQVLVRFPTGERKERRFYSTATIQSLYDYVDSLDCLNAENYSLVSNFPRLVYGPEKHLMSLKEAGLHPQASLFVEVDS
ncbi:plant UBX domain-containing protein 10-like [Telopea speciosissima]|uniref:plant UBX domain-containing protein 10-like n=1 Tax=Telopea speciosissima TaxID=54955 RepID=UPI001CC7B420|nr:plant UBX domain-containing protein 10-like [Telopea speciosissima]